jgi:hypothetical protein
MRSVSLVCALTLLTALGCSGEGDDTLKTACDDHTDCPMGVGCYDGYCQGEAPGTGGGEDTVQASGSAEGPDVSVTVTSMGGQCTTASCEVTEGATVTFAAMEVEGWRFKGWSGDPRCMGDQLVLVIENVSSDISCVAEYVRRFHVTGLAADGGAAPVAMSSAPFATCSGASCEVDVSSVVTLTAAPREAQRLDEFTGEGCDQRDGDTVTVTATGDITCTAVYVAGARVTGEVAGAEASVVATSSSTGASCGDSSCTLDLGGEVTLTAPSIEGHRFAGWSGSAGCTGNELTIVLANVQGDLTCTATYAARRSVRGEAEGATPVPTLAATSASAFAICEGAVCEVDVGSEVELSAPTVSGYRVASWSGEGCSAVSGSEVTVSDVQSHVTCTAHYVLGTSVSGRIAGAPGEITASSSSPGAACADGTCSIDVGGTVTLAAPALSTHRFLGWTGDAGCSGTNLTITLANVQSTRTCTANYRLRVTIAGRAQPTHGGSIAASTSASPATCTGAQCVVDQGSTVVLTASAASGFRFTGWSGGGSCAGTNPALTLANVASDLTCQANFVPRVTASGTPIPTAGGTVAATSASAGASCSGGTCTVDRGSNVNLDPNANSGFRFRDWSGGSGCTGSVDPLVLGNLTASVACNANFVQRFTARGDVTGATGVAVTASSSAAPPVASCSGNQCTVDSGTDVTLTAPSVPGHRFIGWEGAGCTDSDGDVLTMRLASVTAARVCTARYVARITVSGTPNPTAGGSVAASSSSAAASCSGGSCTVDSGSSVSLDVATNAGFRFRDWSGGAGCTGSSDPLVLNGVTATTACTARFAQRFTVSGNVTGAPAGTAVAATSSAAPPVASCSGNSCTVDGGTEVTLTAPNVTGYRFTGWDGAGCTDAGSDGNARTLLLAVTANRACTAGYVQQVTITVARSPSTLGTVSVRPTGGAVCSGGSCTVDLNSSVTITATESGAVRFEGWSGSNGCAGTGAARTFNATATTTCTAAFYGLWSRIYNGVGRVSDITYDLLPRSDGSVVMGGMVGGPGADSRALIGLLDGNSGALSSFRALRRTNFTMQAGGLTGDQTSGYALITGYVSDTITTPVILRFDGNRNLLGATQFFTARLADQMTRITARPGTGYAAAGYLDNATGTPDRGHIIAAATNGSFLWDRMICVPQNCADLVCYSTRANDIVSTGSGFAVLGTAEIPIPGTTAGNAYQITFITELDTNGLTTRERVFARTAIDPASGAQQNVSLEGASLLPLGGGGYVIVGSTREVPGTSVTTYDGFAMRLDADLSIAWQTRVGNAGTDERFGRVALAADRSSYAIAGMALAGTWDGWFVQLTSAGAQNGVDVQYDLGTLDMLISVAVVPTGGYVLGGARYDTTDSDNSTLYDAWALRVHDSGEIAFNGGSGATFADGSHASTAMNAVGGALGCTINQAAGSPQSAITDVIEPAITINQAIQAP